MIQTLKQAGYRYSCPGPARGLAVFQDIETGKLELYARRANGFAGWGLRWHGADWEFCSSGAT